MIRPGRAAVAFRRVCDTASGVLPERMSRVVSGRLIGYAVVNTLTFALDLVLVTAAHDGLGWPVPVAFSVGYGIALTVNFVLQRWLNFPTSGRVGGQVARYAISIAVNYVAVLLVLGSGLAAIGVPYQLARIMAAAGEAVFLYCALRWFVFARSPRRSA